MAYRQGYGRQGPEVMEKASAQVEGVELAGHWNRMFGSRVIQDYDTGTLDVITSLPGGESLGWCYQCAKCVGVCPVDVVGDYGPRKIYRDVLRGLEPFAQPGAELRAVPADHDEPVPQPVPRGLAVPVRRARHGPADRARAALVHPRSIADLAVVVVMRRRRRRVLRGRHVGEVRPEGVPVEGEPEETDAADPDGPAAPEWVVTDDSFDPAHVVVRSV